MYRLLLSCEIILLEHITLVDIASQRVCVILLNDHLPSVAVPPPIITTTAIPGQVAITGSNITLLCNVQLDPSVDSTVIVNTTWTTPGGAPLSGSNPLWIGSSNQSTLMLTSLGTGDVGNYICGVSVTPINAQYITEPMESNSSILGKKICLQPYCF